MAYDDANDNANDDAERHERHAERHDDWHERPLSEPEFDELSGKAAEGGFQQTACMRRLVESNGRVTSLVGLVDSSDTPVAGAMIVYTPSHFGLEGSIWLGPLCDPHDEAMLSAMTDAIRADAHAHHAVSVSCWPNDVYRLHDSDGRPAGEADTVLMGNYGALGWRHCGFTVGYDSVINRWNYVKDLSPYHDEAALLASYSKNTRRNVKIARNSGVEVRRLERDELGVFHDICEMSSRKQHFANRSLEYFQRVYDSFGDRAEFMVAQIHMDEYLSSWQAKLDKASKDVSHFTAALDSTKYPDDVRKKLDTATRNRDSAIRRIEDAEQRIQRDGELVPAAVGLFMWHERELVYFSSGSDERYAKFYAPTALQHEMMSRCLERGVARYNFYGIDGVFDDPGSEGRGVLEFKQGFNGYVEELPGEFMLPVDILRYDVSRLAHRLLGR